MRMCGPRRLDLSRLRLIGVSALLIGLLLPIRGFAAITIAICDGVAHPLPAGNATTDLEVTGPCEVKAGTYTFRSVNIYRKAGAATRGAAP
jgi:hypothetical protein